MNFLPPAKRPFAYYFTILLSLLLITTGIDAQTKRTTKRATTAKKTAAKTKDARKKPAAKASAKKTTAKAASKKATAKKTDTRTSKKSKKPTLAERRAEAARKKKEAQRRAAIIAERKRREEAARIARARKLAFERGLKTATIQNIAKDDTEGEDLQIRRAAVNALGSHAGTVVVMEAQTGKVLTVVNQDWGIRDSFKPCSTIKLVTGVAGLNEDLIDDDGKVKNASTRLDLDDALAYSNNVYFQKVGVNMGSSKMINYAKNLGLGEKTGINADGESAGKLPYGNNNARIYSHGDDFEVTPLQLAVMVSAISNGGNVVVPHIAKTKIEKASYKPMTKRTVALPRATLRGVIPGMMGAAEYGTARRGVDASMGVAGKTGSCISKGSWVGLFASVAPIEQPKYSVVVITRGQSERGKYAAAIAGKIYEALRPRLERDAMKQTELIAAKRKTAVDADPSELDDEEEDDAEVAEADAGDERDVIVAGSSQTPAAAEVPAAPAQKKLVTKTVTSRPTNFPPVVITFKKDGSETKSTTPATRPRIVKNK